MLTGLALHRERWRQEGDFCCRNFQVLEIQDFLFPSRLGPEGEELRSRYREWLRPFPGTVALHGPYLDLSPISLDEAIRRVTRHRYRQVLQVGQELGAAWVVIHGSFLRDRDGPGYRRHWLEANRDFWARFLEEMEPGWPGVLLENVHEPRPDLVGELVRGLDSPRFGVCLDLAHARIFGETPLAAWLEDLGPRIGCLHLSDNCGGADQHLDPGAGDMPWERIAAALEGWPHPLPLVVEAPGPAPRQLSFLKWLQGCVSGGAAPWRSG